MSEPRERKPSRVEMRPSVGAPDPRAVLPLLRRLIDDKKNVSHERRPVPAQQQG